MLNCESILIDVMYLQNSQFLHLVCLQQLYLNLEFHFRLWLTVNVQFSKRKLFHRRKESFLLKYSPNKIMTKHLLTNN